VVDPRVERTAKAERAEVDRHLIGTPEKAAALIPMKRAELAARNITGGCGGSNYCPDAPVSREQMAVFLLTTREPPGYVPPACTSATFSDVPCSSPFARWIYELVARGITSGCGGGNYCPVSPVTRGQMAVFLVATFGLL
jgi:hypothetical protein